MNPTLKKLEIFVTESGSKPFVEWLESLEKTMRYRVKERLNRVIFGNLGDWKYIGKGVSELRLNFGSGYRIYFGTIENITVLLLCGGNKNSQKRDIQKAQKYWTNYLTR